MKKGVNIGEGRGVMEHWQGWPPQPSASTARPKPSTVSCGLHADLAPLGC